MKWNVWLFYKLCFRSQESYFKGNRFSFQFSFVPWQPFVSFFCFTMWERPMLWWTAAEAFCEIGCILWHFEHSIHIGVYHKFRFLFLKNKTVTTVTVIKAAQYCIPLVKTVILLIDHFQVYFWTYLLRFPWFYLDLLRLT